MMVAVRLSTQTPVPLVCSVLSPASLMLAFLFSFFLLVAQCSARFEILKIRDWLNLENGVFHFTFAKATTKLKRNKQTNKKANRGTE